MVKYQLALLSLLLSWVVSCKTTGEIEEVFGIYRNNESGEYLEFLAQGVFRYNIIADATPTDINQKPPYVGRYKITRDGEIKVTPISVHLGLFTIGLSESKDQVFITHRFSGRQLILEKVE